MSAPADLVAAMQALVAGVADTAADPSDAVRMLVALATAPATEGGSGALDALARRAALASLGRASASVQPRSYDEAQALRTAACGLLADEEIVAADAGEDAVAAALRALRGAVDRDLSRRGASLSPLRQVALRASLPALVVAQRLYGDAARADELIGMAGDPPNPVFMPERFRGLAR